MTGFEHQLNRIRFVPLELDDTKGTQGEETLVLVPVLPASLLTPFELTVEGSQIANTLRNKQDISLEEARDLVAHLVPQLRDPGGMVRLFARGWQVYDKNLGHRIEWLLEMNISFYDPDIVTACSFRPHRLLIERYVELSSDLLAAWNRNFDIPPASDELRLRLKPRAQVLFDKSFLESHSLRVALALPGCPSQDSSYYHSVPVFHDLTAGNNYFSVSKVLPTHLDKGRSSKEQSFVYGISRLDGKDIRWDLMISKQGGDRISITNTGNQSLKVLVTSGPYEESRLHCRIII